MPEPRKNPNELGALWMKTNDRGDYMTGTIGGEKVIVFKNDHKTKDTQPDWRVFKSKPRGPVRASDHTDEPMPAWTRTRGVAGAEPQDPGDYPDPEDGGFDGL